MRQITAVRKHFSCVRHGEMSDGRHQNPFTTGVYSIAHGTVGNCYSTMSEPLPPVGDFYNDGGGSGDANESGGGGWGAASAAGWKWLPASRRLVG